MKRRIELFDVWRSFAILLMVAYHFMYDLYLFGVIGRATMFSDWAYAICYAAAGSFMLISGAVVCHSRNSVKRGAVVFLWGMVVTVAMSFMGMKAQFGVLHHLGTMMIAYGLISRKIKPPKGWWFPVVCVAVFVLTYYVYDTVRLDAGKWLFPLGIRPRGFVSADYYPLLPWGMLFAIGVWMGGVLEGRREMALMQQRFHPALTIAGRHSLIIYLAHQPILYGICWLLFGRGG